MIEVVFHMLVIRPLRANRNSVVTALSLYKNAADAKLVKDLVKRWRFYKGSLLNFYSL